MNKVPKWLLIVVGVLALVVVAGIAIKRGGLEKVTPQVEQPEKPLVVGMVQIWRRLDRYTSGLKEGLKDLGYEEGKNIVYKYQSWEHDPSKVPGIVQSYIDENVDLIYAVGAESAYRALELSRKANKGIPILYTIADKPDKIGLVQSFQSSGNQVTGVASNMGELVPKQLEIFKRINPKAKKLGIFTDGFHIPAPTAPGIFFFEALRKHAPEFGLELTEYKTDVPPSGDLDKAWTDAANTIKPGDIDAIVHIPGHFLVYQDVNEVALGKKLGIPNIMPIVEEVEASGGLMTVSADGFDVGKQAAVMAGKIFKGVHPSQIPSEMPRKEVFILNLTKAKEIGLTIPQEIIDLADVKF